MQSQRITIFDTTLRDGQQAPNAAMQTISDAIEYAKLADSIGVE
jgi:isopropylmalate/homocitrate/citramalate synthase